MECLQSQKESELLPRTIARSSVSFEVIKHRLKSLASPPTSIVALSLSPQPEPAQSLSKIATPTTAIEPALNTSTAVGSVLPLPKIFIVQNFHVSPSMPIDEKIQNVWKEKISDRLSAEIRCGIPTGLCLQEFMMAGERPDALRPSVVISCGDKAIKKDVEKIFKRQQWLHGLLKAHRITFVALVAKTHLSAGPVSDDKSMLALAESYALQVEQSKLTTSCGLKLLISDADKRVQQHCTLGGLLMVNGKILGLTAGHPFRKIEQYLVEQDSSGADPVSDSPDAERSSISSNEPFIFNENDDDDSNDTKTTSTLSLPENKEDCPFDSNGLFSEVPSRSDFYAPSEMWQVPGPSIVPDSGPRQVSLVEDYPHDYDWQLLPSLSPVVTSRPNKVAHVDLRHNIPIEEIVSGPASGEVVINIAISPPQLGYLHSSPAKLQIDKSVFDVQLITLEHVLPLGSSGAWVVLGAKLCGYIIAVRQDIPWAYMVAIVPVMKDIERKFKTDDVRLPTAAEIRSLTVPSKTLNAGPSDVLGEDDQNRILVVGQTSTSKESSKTPWQAQEMLSGDPSEILRELPSEYPSEIPSEIPSLTLSEYPSELPSELGQLPLAKYDCPAFESEEGIGWHDDKKSERANPTSFNAAAENPLFNEKSNLPVQEENGPITENPSVLPVASQTSVAPMAERTELRRELQRTLLEQTPRNASTSTAARAGSLPYALTIHPVQQMELSAGNDFLHTNDHLHSRRGTETSPEALDRLSKASWRDRMIRTIRTIRTISWPRRIWRSLEARTLRSEFRRRRMRGFAPLRAPIYPQRPYYDSYDVRTALFGDIEMFWYYLLVTVIFGIRSLLYIIYFVVFSPFILWVTYRHCNVLADRRTLELQQEESIEMLGILNSDHAFLERRHLPWIR